MDPNSVALQRTTLENLSPTLSNVLIVGIIIGKQKPRKYLDTKSPVAGLYRAVWNFTLRDSVRDYINVTYWGSTEVIFQVNDKFHTRDVVEIINPIINVRNLNDHGEQYRPMVTSPYSLTLNEKSSIIRHEGNISEYLQLLKLPTKPIAGFLPLRDIHNNGAAITDFVNILVIVKGLGPIRTCNSRTNNETFTIRTVEVFDHTSPSLKVDIWENDIIQRSDHWRPRNTALFMTDLKIAWSNFQRQFIAKVTGRTIVTENPESKEAQKLLIYAKMAPIETFDILDQLITSLPNPNTIQDVMTVRQVHDKMNIFSAEKQFTVLLYSFISEFDLDGLSRTLLIKCGKCKVEIKTSKCENSECPTVYENELVDPEFNFDIRVNVTDHTGTLMNCRLSGHAAEETLGCTAREFSNLSDEEKQMLKWKYLMERCAVYVAVLFVGHQKPVISILKIRLENPLEAIQKIAVY
ncbi:unnamed protein product [Psylliodes chrysocephalus]|uniref:MEIOB-like N-terminal domain-containing protein n=1 Tax=Psylliodes chrysocephalus TaxID=3402493 RepID=A0A9P0D3P9_9CUCU|nr:unnamed protein product [Psylliodes chrysocephala]